MICEGTMSRNGTASETKFINQDDLEIFYGYRNKFAPLKLMVSGCNGKYNYICETQVVDNHTHYTITKNDDVVLTITRARSIRPKAVISGYNRDLDIKFSIGLGFAKVAVMESKQELASMTMHGRNYTLEIDDKENPTLMTAILTGAAEVNDLAGNTSD